MVRDSRSLRPYTLKSFGPARRPLGISSVEHPHRISQPLVPGISSEIRTSRKDLNRLSALMQFAVLFIKLRTLMLFLGLIKIRIRLNFLRKFDINGLRCEGGRSTTLESLLQDKSRCLRAQRERYGLTK